MNRSTFSPINFSTGCPKSMCPRPYSKCWRGEALQPMNQTTESCVVSVQNRSVQFDKTSSTKHVETLQRFSFKLVLPNTCNSQSCYWLFFFFTLTEKICGENGIKKKKKKRQCSHHLYTNAKVSKSTRYSAYEAEVFFGFWDHYMYILFLYSDSCSKFNFQ